MLLYSTSGSGSSSSNLTLFGVHGRFNFIKNQPGNDLIPYIGANLATGAISVLGVSGSAQQTDLQLGVVWFPFSQIFAFSASYSMSNSQANFSGATSKTTNNTLATGWSIYF